MYLEKGSFALLPFGGFRPYFAKFCAIYLKSKLAISVTIFLPVSRSRAKFGFCAIDIAFSISAAGSFSCSVI